jgi:hypothetical protein
VTELWRDGGSQVFYSCSMSDVGRLCVEMEPVQAPVAASTAAAAEGVLPFGKFRLSPLWLNSKQQEKFLRIQSPSRLATCVDESAA